MQHRKYNRNLIPLLAAGLMGVFSLLSTTAFADIVYGVPARDGTYGVPTNGATANQVTVVSMQGYTLSPQTVTIMVGQAVMWSNDDPSNQYMLGSDDRSIASNYIIPGQSYTQPFYQEGTYSYRCSNLPFMTGEVIVKSVTAYMKDKINEKVTQKIQELKQANPELK